ncbi:MAG: NAD-dependent epimerase/dehydratase family protein [Chloroflexi bacterium]|nr:NAD-dependent epimerase/dehydratase family protein [Chloroflexota bacterium]
MKNKQTIHVVFGASGGIGSAVTRLLAEQGKSVRAVNRSGQMDFPESVEIMAADATDLVSTRKACAGAAVVYNCIHPRPGEEYDLFVTMSENILVGAEEAGAKLILAASVYPYGKVDRPMTEGMPHNPAEPTGKLHAKGVEMALEAHKKGRVCVAVGRASNYFGPNAGRSFAGDGIFYNALFGKSASVIGNVDTPHTYTYVDDFANALITLGERDEALGEIWHVPSAATITTRQFIEMAYKEAGEEPKILAGTRFPLTFMALFSKHMRFALRILYQFDRPFIVDHSKFEKAFGANTTPHLEGIQRTLAWYRKEYQVG